MMTKIIDGLVLVNSTVLWAMSTGGFLAFLAAYSPRLLWDRLVKQ